MSPTAPSREIELFPNPQPGRDYTIRMRIPEFTCLCPRTGQPDFATLELEYVPDQLCVELKSLKLYVWSFRDRGAFHEAVTNEIADLLAASLEAAVPPPHGALQRARRHLHDGCRRTPTSGLEPRRPRQPALRNSAPEGRTFRGTGPRDNEGYNPALDLTGCGELDACQEGCPTQETCCESRAAQGARAPQGRETRGAQGKAGGRPRQGRQADQGQVSRRVAAARPARPAKSVNHAPAARDPAIVKPKPAIPAAQVAEARASLASPPGARLRAGVPSDDDEDGTASHNLLLGPRNVRPYRERKGEMYMGREQLDHFRGILSSWKRDLMEEVDRTMSHMKDEAANPPDPNDRATLESEFALELRTRDRERKLIRKIEEALSRIEDGSYGYCVETGEPIGVKRLEARPVATLCIEAQERRERREKQYGDRDDWYR